MCSVNTVYVYGGLTFDPDCYGVLNVAYLVGGGACVFTSIIKRRLLDLNHLVKVFYFHAWCHCKIISVLCPGDVRSWP